MSVSKFIGKRLIIELFALSKNGLNTINSSLICGFSKKKHRFYEVKHRDKIVTISIFFNTTIFILQIS